MFSTSSAPEIDITEFTPSNDGTETPDSPSEDEYNPDDLGLENFQKLVLDVPFENEVEPSKAVQFEDLLSHIQDGLTVIVCSPVEFMVKNTVAGKHLDVLVAGSETKKVVLVCVDSEQLPLNFKEELILKSGIDKAAPFYCYYGADDTSKIFALRLSTNSTKCKFASQESHFSSTFFPYF